MAPDETPLRKALTKLLRHLEGGNFANETGFKVTDNVAFIEAKRLLNQRQSVSCSCAVCALSSAVNLSADDQHWQADRPIGIRQRPAAVGQRALGDLVGDSAASSAGTVLQESSQTTLGPR